MISENDKIQLKKMVEANNASDHTNKIRENKHSGEIRRCVLYICEKKRLGLSKSMLEAAVELEGILRSRQVHRSTAKSRTRVRARAHTCKSAN